MIELLRERLASFQATGPRPIKVLISRAPLSSECRDAPAEALRAMEMLSRSR